MVDGEGHGTGEDQNVGAAESGHATLDSVEQGIDESVLGARGVDQVQLDLSVDARRTPEQKMGRVAAELMPSVPLAHGEGVDESDPARRRAEGGLQHHGAVEVAASHVSGVRGLD